MRRARAAATRGRVLTAARELFVERGWAATVPEIAARAEVSGATVELHFRTKAALLAAVVDVALAGDDEPVPILERAWVAELEALPAPEFLAAAGAAFAAGAGRVTPVLTAVDAGAGQDVRLAELARQLRERRDVMARWLVDRVVERGALAGDLGVSDAVETVLVVLDPAVHRRLLVERGWTPDQLGSWLGRSLRRLLLET